MHLVPWTSRRRSNGCPSSARRQTLNTYNAAIFSFFRYEPLLVLMSRFRQNAITMSTPNDLPRNTFEPAPLTLVGGISLIGNCADLESNNLRERMRLL